MCQIQKSLLSYITPAKLPLMEFVRVRTEGAYWSTVLVRPEQDLFFALIPSGLSHCSEQLELSHDFIVVSSPGPLQAAVITSEASFLPASLLQLTIHSSEAVVHLTQHLLLLKSGVKQESPPSAFSLPPTAIPKWLGGQWKEVPQDMGTHHRTRQVTKIKITIPERVRGGISL